MQLAGNINVGRNVLAVQLHNNAGSSDAYLDLQLALDTQLVPLVSAWRIAGSVDLNGGWSEPNFDESGGDWQDAITPVGYDTVTAEPTFRTLVPEGLAGMFLRREFTLSQEVFDKFESFVLKVIFDASADVYVNGERVIDTDSMLDEEPAYYNRIAANVPIRAGRNALATRVLNPQPSSDMFFAAVLEGIVPGRFFPGETAVPLSMTTSATVPTTEVSVSTMGESVSTASGPSGTQRTMRTRPQRTTNPVSLPTNAPVLTLRPMRPVSTNNGDIVLPTVSRTSTTPSDQMEDDASGDGDGFEPYIWVVVVLIVIVILCTIAIFCVSAAFACCVACLTCARDTVHLPQGRRLE